jgi:uncharacterized protein YceH (UPF0502 family)
MSPCVPPPAALGPSLHPPFHSYTKIDLGRWSPPVLDTAAAARMLGSMRLNAEEARVLGSLMEKSLTTPQQYPLTLTSLVAACNQATNRDPVVDFDEETVMAALDDLKGERLVRFVLPSSGRTAVRYRHVVDETLALDLPQCALLSVLLLRGPQTIGELRLRTDRMTEFDGLDQVEHELDLLAAMEVPLASSLGRLPGQKEERWASPLVASGPGEQHHATRGGEVPRGSTVVGEIDADPVDGSPGDRFGTLQAEFTVLRSEVSELRRDLDALRLSLGG